jgi:hypothetical protein
MLLISTRPRLSTRSIMNRRSAGIHPNPTNRNTHKDTYDVKASQEDPLPGTKVFSFIHEKPEYTFEYEGEPTYEESGEKSEKVVEIRNTLCDDPGQYPEKSNNERPDCPGFGWSLLLGV